MKKKPKQTEEFYFHGEEDLFIQALFLMEDDLTDPIIEAEARDLLRKFRERGHFFEGVATEDDGCLLSLYEALSEAVNSDPDDLAAAQIGNRLH